MEEGFAEDIFLILAGNELAVYGFTSRSALLTQLDWSVLPLPPPGSSASVFRRLGRGVARRTPMAPSLRRLIRSSI